MVIRMCYKLVKNLDLLNYKVCVKCNWVNYYPNIDCVHCGNSGKYKPITDRFIQDLKTQLVEVKVR